MGESQLIRDVDEKMSASLGPKLSFISRRFTDDRLDYSDLPPFFPLFKLKSSASCISFLMLTMTAMLTWTTWKD